MDSFANYTILLKKEFSLNNTLVYRKKLDEPISLGRKKCIFHLSVSGYRNWLNDYEESIVRGTLDEANYSFTLRKAEISEKVKIPFRIFLSEDFSEILETLKTEILRKLKATDFELYTVKDNIFFFKMLVADVSIAFSDALCDFLGFKREVWYDNQCLVNIFIPQRHLMDETCDVVGLQTNFAYNPYLNRDCVGFFFSGNIGRGSYFSETIVSSKQKLNIKSDVLEEIEIRFLNLSSNKIFKSCSYQTDYVILNLGFSFS